MKKIIYALILTLTIFFFKSLNQLALTIGFGWSKSFFFPYLLLLVFGVLFAFSIKGFLRLIPSSIKWLLILLISVAPFGVGFALHPIYEGDISLGGNPLKDAKINNTTQGFDLIVITIPNCPFCIESTKKINKLTERNPDLKIKYVICTSDQKAIQQLRPLLSESIRIELAKDIQQMVDLAQGSFPTFIKIKESKAIYKWSNDQFGFFALDKVEQNDF